jgi:hypothetical protein
MKQERYLHIQLLHFTDNINEPDMTWKFCQVKEDAKSVWNSKQGILKILQSFWISGCRWSYCFVQRKGHFPTIHTQETQTFWQQNLQTMWWDWMHVWYDSLLNFI